MLDSDTQGRMSGSSAWPQSSRPAAPADRQGAGDAAISPDPWGGSPQTARLPPSAAPTLQCLLTGLQGLLLPAPGGSANPPASPQGVSDGGLALAGMTEQQIEMNSSPPAPLKSNHEQEGDCDPASDQCCDHPGGG